ncbi:hypothetical protein [Actinopolymorpha pittospori]|uniref:Uncharacterized protein n=1 Tax=Actinopolymorpha pittospori TaxID=648752 RepID=A0A927R7J8_9ACTN|nr:hypothetical protein [Actinopolymorpha pittospori]MBE1605657.1 hypothetical protein [Actinopolymorpha pittospori]
MQQLDIPVLVDPWQDLCNPDQAIASQVHDLTRELLAELAHGHPLHGAPFTIIGRSYVRDDVLLDTPHGWALVHLTLDPRPRAAAVSLHAILRHGSSRRSGDRPRHVRSRPWQSTGSAIRP